MKEVILLTAVFAGGVVLTTVFEAEVKAIIVALLTKIATKIEGK